MLLYISKYANITLKHTCWFSCLFHKILIAEEYPSGGKWNVLVFFVLNENKSVVCVLFWLFLLIVYKFIPEKKFNTFSLELSWNYIVYIVLLTAVKRLARELSNLWGSPQGLVPTRIILNRWKHTEKYKINRKFVGFGVRSKYISSCGFKS